MDARHVGAFVWGPAMNLTRKILHDLLWAYPATRVAASLGISSSSLAKTCQRRGIPTPERGYWQRIASGHVLSVPPLAPVDFELPLPWIATPEIEFLLQRRAGIAPIGSRQGETVAAEPAAQHSSAPTPSQKSHQLSEPDSFLHLVGGVSPHAMQMAALAREIKASERFCVEVLRVAKSQPLAVGDVMEAWVHAVRRDHRERDAMAALIEQCTKIAQGTLHVQWWASVSEPGGALP